MSVIIRIAEEKDVKAISRIYEEIHSAEENGKITVGWQRGVYPTEKTARTAFVRRELYVLETDGIIAASAIINSEQPPAYSTVEWSVSCCASDVLVLHTLTVSPEFSGMGFGKRMLKFYEDMAAQRNIRCLRLDTNEKNTVARKMYKSAGYEEKGIIPCEFNGMEKVFLVFLEKILKK